jgi:hypothetical protein
MGGRGKIPIRFNVIESGNKLAISQIAGSPEDDDVTGPW